MFADVSSVIADNPAGLHRGVAVFDSDGDGRSEFVVAGFGGPNRVLKWKGGQLRDLRVPALADAHQHTVGLAAGDLDGDGEEELYVRNDEGEDRLWKRLPDGRWENLFDRHFNATPGNSAVGRSVVAADRRGVGRYGFFVANVGRRMRLYELGPDGTLADIAPWLGLSDLAGGCGALAVPLLGDAPDLFCGNEGVPNFLFRNLGDGTFEECAGRLGLSDAGEHTRGAVAVDADGDGRLALCWGNWEGPHRLMVRRPDGAWKDRATPGLAFPLLGVDRRRRRLRQRRARRAVLQQPR
jgi:hypothetical protein